jgi:hypothetical protein
VAALALYDRLEPVGVEEMRGLCGPFSVARRPVGELKRPLGDAAPPDTGG